MTPVTPRMWVPVDRFAGGRFEVRLNVASALDDAALALIGQALDRLCRAANCGACPPPSASPAAVRLTATPARVDAGTVAIDLSAEGFDLYGLELLRNMLARLERDNVFTRAIMATRVGDMQPSVEKPGPVDDPQAADYPAMSSEVSFDVAYADVDYGKFRRCLIDFIHPVDRALASRVDAIATTWFELLEAGAFAMPLGRANEVHCIAGAATLFDERAMEITVDRFQASESAWEALLNMLDAGWHDAGPIHTVTVE